MDKHGSQPNAPTAGLTPEAIGPDMAAPAAVARVIEASDGIPMQVRFEKSGIDYAVAGRSESLGFVRHGDRVMVHLLGDGPVVTQRLCEAGEGVRASVREIDGKLHIEAPRNLVLVAGQSRVELTADGHIRLAGHRVELDGQEISQAAEERLVFQGMAILFN